MFTLLSTDEFERRFAKLPKPIQRKALKQQRMFSSNPSHPSLNTEKISPKEKGVWTFRVNYHYRIAFRFVDGKTVLLLTVVPHDWIYTLRW